MINNARVARTTHAHARARPFTQHIKIKFIRKVEKYKNRQYLKNKIDKI